MCYFSQIGKASQKPLHEDTQPCCISGKQVRFFLSTFTNIFYGSNDNKFSQEKEIPL
jgi:hypothetical protein